MALGLALALTACGSAGSSQSSTAGGKDAKAEASGDLPVLRVAMMPFITSLPTEYIRKNKLDEKAGFKMDTIMFATGAPMNEALAADLWDVGSMGAAAVTGVANYDMMIIGEVLESTDGLGVFVKPDSPAAQEKGYNPSYPGDGEGNDDSSSDRHGSAFYHIKMAGKTGTGYHRCEYCKYGYGTGLPGAFSKSV